VVLACGLDRLVGDPPGLLHPVQVMGWFIARLRRVAELVSADRPGALRFAGAVITLLLVGGSGTAGWAVEWLARQQPLLGQPLLVIALASALAGGSLEQAVRSVLDALPDLAEARQRLAWIVGRETSGLDEAEILRAAAETASENAVDGLFAPLFWMFVGASIWSLGWWTAPGPLALAWGFKAASTLDSMLGYRHGQLRWLGTAGARLDDGLVWLPCRLVVLTLPLVHRCAWLDQVRASLLDGRPDPSPNAGVSQAAFAHAAAVQLGGLNRYADGWKQKPILAAGQPPADLAAVLRILNLSGRLWLLWLVAAGIGVFAADQSVR
jgi:adenosylcobinamide-phosphate synthase